MIKIAAIGDNVVDCYVANKMMYPGGNTLNVSVFFRRFGGQAAYIGAVGMDIAGRQIQSALQQEGVDISHLHICEGPTAYCVIGHKNADRVFITFDLGVSMFTPTESDFIFLASQDAVHVGHTSGLDAHLSRFASQSLLSYDFATVRDPEHIASVASLCFLATASAGDLSEASAAALQQRLLDAGATWALVTKGKAGAILSDGTNMYSVSPTPVEVVDTLGAGDTFIARTLYGLLNQEQPSKILAKAADAAAHTCRYFGAIGHEVPISISANLSEFSPAGV